MFFRLDVFLGKLSGFTKNSYKFGSRLLNNKIIIPRLYSPLRTYPLISDVRQR